jgi:hypothetical protein
VSHRWILGERHLRRTLHEFATHYHRERNHQGLANELIDGLLDECPILTAALTAVLERRTTFVSPTAFEFISTTAQIGDIRLFMRTLPGVLSG